MKFSEISCYLLPVESKYFPQDRLPQHPALILFCYRIEEDSGNEGK